MSPSTRSVPLMDGPRTPGEMWSCIASAEWKNMETKNKTISLMYMYVSVCALFTECGYLGSSQVTAFSDSATSSCTKHNGGS
jgi:hypothetical protein